MRERGCASGRLALPEPASQRDLGAEEGRPVRVQRRLDARQLPGHVGLGADQQHGRGRGRRVPGDFVQRGEHARSEGAGDASAVGYEQVVDDGLARIDADLMDDHPGAPLGIVVELDREWTQGARGRMGWAQPAAVTALGGIAVGLEDLDGEVDRLPAATDRPAAGRRLPAGRAPATGADRQRRLSDTRAARPRAVARTRGCWPATDAGSQHRSGRRDGRAVASRSPRADRLQRRCLRGPPAQAHRSGPASDPGGRAVRQPVQPSCLYRAAHKALRAHEPPSPGTTRPRHTRPVASGGSCPIYPAHSRSAGEDRHADGINNARLCRSWQPRAPGRATQASRKIAARGGLRHPRRTVHGIPSLAIVWHSRYKHWMRCGAPARKFRQGIAVTGLARHAPPASQCTLPSSRCPMRYAH